MTGLLTASIGLKSGTPALVLNTNENKPSVEVGSLSVSPKNTGLSFCLYTDKAESLKSYVPTRGMSVSARRIGASTDSETTLKKVVQNLLAMNGNATFEEQTSSTYLNLAFSRVFKNLSNREMIVLAVQSSQPKFIVFTRGVPVYTFSVLDSDGPRLVFTNEASLDLKLKDLDPKCCVYRLPVVTEGVCVIQAYYLEKKFVHWTNVLRDNLKVMSALEAHLAKRWIGSTFC